MARRADALGQDYRVTDDDMDLRELILDRNQSTAARLQAIARLGATSPATSKETLLDLCSRHDEPEELLRASGRELARLHEVGLTITNFDLRDMSSAAMDELCDE